MKVLVACEFSGVVRDAFAQRGHDAWSCDLLPTEKPGQHIEGDCLAAIQDCGPWDLMVAHPPCTYLCQSGSRWLFETPANPTAGNKFGVERIAAMDEGVAFFLALLNAPVPRVAIENPMPHTWAMQRINRPYDQRVQPWYFGDPQKKGTCLWLRGLPPLMPTTVTPPPKGLEAVMAWEAIWRCPPGPLRGHIRSKTFGGIAEAMADQWGTLPDPTSLDSLLWVSTP